MLDAVVAAAARRRKKMLSKGDLRVCVFLLIAAAAQKHLAIIMRAMINYAQTLSPSLSLSLLLTRSVND